MRDACTLAMHSTQNLGLTIALSKSNCMLLLTIWVSVMLRPSVVVLSNGESPFFSIASSFSRRRANLFGLLRRSRSRTSLHSWPEQPKGTIPKEHGERAMPELRTRGGERNMTRDTRHKAARDGRI